MTSQGRSAGSVVCIVFAALSMIAAVIVSVTVLTSTAQVADEPERPNSLQPALFQDAACGGRPDTAADQIFLECLSASESQAQADAAFWQTKAAARQAGTQARGDLAIVLGLLGLVFAVGARVFDRRGGSVPQASGQPASPPVPTA